MRFCLVLILAALLLAAGFSAVGYATRQADAQSLALHLERNTAKLQSIAQLSQVDLERQGQILATLLASDPVILHILRTAARSLRESDSSPAAKPGTSPGPDSSPDPAQLQRLRLSLLKHLEAQWEELQHSMQLRQMHFILGTQSVSFLRLHAPNEHGDILPLSRSASRVLADGVPRQGYEVGRFFNGVRAIAPVFDRLTGEQPVAVIEIGFDPATALDPLDARLDTGFAIALRANTIRSEMAPEALMQSQFLTVEGCDCFVQPGSRPLPDNWQNALRNELLHNQPSSQIVPGQHEIHHLVAIPLPPSPGLGSGDSVAWLLAWQEIESEVLAYTSPASRLQFMLPTYLIALATLLTLLTLARQHWLRTLRERTQALRESEAYNRLLFADSPIPQLVIDPDTLRILEGNEAAAKLFGLPDAGGLSGQNCSTLSAPVQADGRPAAISLRAQIEQALQHGQCAHEWQIRRIDNALRSTELRLSRVRIRHQTLLEASLIDTTETQRAFADLQSSENHFRQFFEENTAVVLMLAPRSGRILAANTAAQVFYGRSLDELCSLRLQQISSRPEEVVSDQLRRAVTQEQNPFDCTHRLADGSERDVKIYSSPIDHDGGKFLLSIVHDVTEELAARRTVEQLMQKNALLLRAAGEGIYGIDQEGNGTFINPAAQKMLGLKDADFFGRNAHTLFHAHQTEGQPYPPERCPVQLTLHDGVARKSEEWFKHRNGKLFPISLTVTPIPHDGKHQRQGAVVVFSDITAERATQNALIAAQARLATILANFQGAILVEDDQHVVVLCNPAYCEMFGIQPPADQLSGSDSEAALAIAAAAQTEDENFLLLIDRLRRKRSPSSGLPLACHDGRQLELDYNPIQVGEHFLGHLWVFRDQTERVERERELLRLATTDPLTGVSNRRAFLRRVDEELARIRRYSCHSALMMCDLDFFKRVNDEFGHAAGDEVLRHFAAQARMIQREVDVIGRLGGEEFAILLPDTDSEGAHELAERLRSSIENAPAQTENGEIPFTLSIGVALLTPEDQNPDAPLARADKLLYQAKESGRNKVCAHLEDALE